VLKIIYRTVFCIVLVSAFISCFLKTIPPEKQYRADVVPAPMREVFKLVRPSLIKFNYRIVEADVAVGAVKAVSKSNFNKQLIVTVSATDDNKSHVRLKLDVRKLIKTGEYRRLHVPEKTMRELDGILTEIKRRAAYLR